MKELSKPVPAESHQPELFHRSPLDSVDSKSSFAASSYHAIERYEMPLFMARAILYIVSVLLIVTFAWCALARVDVVAVAPGKTVPRAKVRPIQPEADGVVESIFVQEGQKIVANQKLVQLDATSYMTEVDQCTREMNIAQNILEQIGSAKSALKQLIADPSMTPIGGVDVANIGSIVARVHAASVATQESSKDTAFNTTTQGPGETSQLAEEAGHLTASRSAERAIRDVRKRENDERLAQKRLEIESNKRQLKAAQEETVHLKSILDKTMSEESAYNMLAVQGAVSHVDHLRLQREVSRVQQELVRLSGLEAELSKKIDIAISAEKQLKAESMRADAEQEGKTREISASLSQVNIQLRTAKRRHALNLAELDSSLAAARSALARLETDEVQALQRLAQSKSALALARHKLECAELKAPLAGTVTNIVTKGHGQVVHRGDALMSIVPDSSEMLVECQVGSKDIGFVEKGQSAKLKLAAFPFEDFGTIPGCVIAVAKESHFDPRLGLVYKTTIAPARQSIRAKGKDLPFASGMETTCEIVIRQKSILSILLEPAKRLRETRWQ